MGTPEETDAPVNRSLRNREENQWPRGSKQRSFIPWVITLVLLLFALPNFGFWSATGQDKTPGIVRVQRTEFKVVPVQFSDYKTSPQWKNILARSSNNEELARASFHELLLNTLAKDGWELIQITTEDKKNAAFYLKRPLAPK